MTDIEPLDLSATALAAAIRDGTITSFEVVSAHLRWIERVNPHICAMVELSRTALDEAKRADDILDRGKAVGRLHGVPFTVKDGIETKGLVCAAAHEQRRTYVPDRDATVVARMRAAGAILLRKTKPGSTADVHPAPKNPFNPAHTPGASSSGEAAIVAARGSPLGIGSDSGSSLRWPAHCCGVAALKPTNGLVPLTGHFPPIIAQSDPRTVIGPMARTVAAVADAVEALRAHGANVTEDRPARIEEALAITRAYWARPESMSEQTWRPWGKSTLSADDVERSLFEWHRLRAAFTRFMQAYDLMVCPVAAPGRNESAAEDYVFTLPFSLTGYPCAVVRAGTSGDGLPIGVQIAAKPFRDHVALAAASLVESLTGRWPAPSFTESLRRAD
jgi:amidase